MYALFAVMRAVVEAVDVVGCLEVKIIENDSQLSLGQARLPISLDTHSLVLKSIPTTHNHMADSNPTIALLHSSTLISQGAEAASLVDFN